jgi:hypothetical protein
MRAKHFAGYLYVMKPELRGKVKVGRSADPSRRAEQLTSTAGKGRFTVVDSVLVPCAPCAERRLLDLLGGVGKFEREYFAITADFASSALRQISDQSAASDLCEDIQKRATRKRSKAAASVLVAATFSTLVQSGLRSVQADARNDKKSRKQLLKEAIYDLAAKYGVTPTAA